MSLLDTLDSDLKTALLAGDRIAASTLRLLKSELKNAEIASGKSLEEEVILQTIRREVKKRQEAVDLFTSSGKTELAEKEKTEAAVLAKYLPAQIDRATVEEYIRGLVAQGTTQKGDLIRQTLAHFGNQTDGRTVSDVVSQSL